MEYRVDLQGTESNLVRYHKYHYEPNIVDVLNWAKRVAPQLAGLWNMPVKATGYFIGPDAPPVYSTTVDIFIAHPNGDLEQS